MVHITRLKRIRGNVPDIATIGVALDAGMLGVLLGIFYRLGNLSERVREVERRILNLEGEVNEMVA